MLDVFIGYDQREEKAYNVCVRSLLDHASLPVRIHTLNEDVLRAQGFYWRPFKREGGQRIDLIDSKPFSTSFSFTRFLVPELMHQDTFRFGRDMPDLAIFVDCDFLWRADIIDLIVKCHGDYPLWCVHHDFNPDVGTKMDGQRQEPYPRKNWSSLMVWNLHSPAHHILDPAEINTRSGSFLHAFGWLNGAPIGKIDEAWNWLEGHSSPEIDPKAVHHTRGTPDMEGYENVAYADEWWAALNPPE